MDKYICNFVWNFVDKEVLVYLFYFSCLHYAFILIWIHECINQLFGCICYFFSNILMNKTHFGEMIKVFFFTTRLSYDKYIISFSFLQKNSAVAGAITGAALALTAEDASHEQIVQCAITGAALSTAANVLAGMF